MTKLDVYGEYLVKRGMKSAGKIAKDVAKWKRTNWVAYKRKRASETVQVAQAQAEASKAQKSIQELMTGLKR